MNTTANNSRTEQFENRVRFNWGFHNAAQDVREGRERKDTRNHFDATYATGYSAGWGAAAQGRCTDSSEDAWLDALAWGDVTE